MENKSPPPSSSCSSCSDCDCDDDKKKKPKSAEECPVLIFLLFQKAVRLELDGICAAAAGIAANGVGDVAALTRRCRFLFGIYKHHCNAEDEVIFPALDMRVKNVARTYSLEHQGERLLFGQLFELLNSSVENADSFYREIASCTRAICTSLNQHMSKEEEQVFPLLIEKFTFEEQADLVWQFFCSIPLNMMAEFLPWLSSCISPDENEDIMKCLFKIVPEEKLLQEVIFSWMEGKSSGNLEQSCNESNEESQFQDCISSGPDMHLGQTERQVWACEHSRTGKRKHIESECLTADPTGMHPINEILHWHNAIKGELSNISEVAKKMHLSGDFSDLSSFNTRLQFIADVCMFHSIAEDQVIFPAIDRKSSFVQGHSEESQIDNLWRAIEKILSAGSNFSSELSLHADQIMDSIQRHCMNEETKVLPLARLRFCPEKQRELLYKSIFVMPLKLLERVLPWLFATLSDKEATSFLQNMQMAASASDAALVTLLSSWACKDHSQGVSLSGLLSFSLKTTDVFPLEEKNDIQDNCSQALCTCSCPLSSEGESSPVATDNDKRPVKRCNFSGFCGNVDEIECSIANIIEPYFAPGLGVDNSNLGIGSLAASKTLHSSSYNSSIPSLNSSLFLSKTESIKSNREEEVRPIDTIFKFHKVICKDLEYLDVESGKILGCDEAFLRHFSGRFRLLWGLYRAHSNAEDDIVFPALESKEALHNVSHSYTLDHKHEDKLFGDIYSVLEELSELHECYGRANATSDATGIDYGSSVHYTDWTKKSSKLATKLQGMCKSIRVSLEHHVYMEELELWPLFDKHFSVDEQDKIVGRIIGTTGAEVLQSMLPWVTSALTQEEQNKMMDTWKQATKNTMFSEWLNNWWKETPTCSQHVTEENDAPSGAEYEVNLDQNDQMFKPGWNDIFRMNQSELESEIRKVSRDPTLDPRRKTYLIQNLYTSQWIAAQQKLPQESTEEHTDGENVFGCFPSFRDPEEQIFGCEHYKRNCKLRAACCNKFFACRFCHDNVSDHLMDRKETTEMLCMRCLEVQPVGPTCKTPSCGEFSMAKYFCNICKFFDDERTIYHCPFCNLCRVGKGLGTDFFHCMGCNVCLGMKLVQHKCRENILEVNCPICCDDLFTSSAPLRALRCGHFMHSACFQAYTCSHYTCPMCSKSLGDMRVYFGMLDALLAAEELPEEYKEKSQDILCNDCDKKGKSLFHWLYHKCSSCGSYNTRVIKSEADGCSPLNP